MRSIEAWKRLCNADASIPAAWGGALSRALLVTSWRCCSPLPSTRYGKKDRALGRYFMRKYDQAVK